MWHPKETSDCIGPLPLLPDKEGKDRKALLSLSSHGKIFKWQDNRPFGKIIDGAIRNLGFRREE